MVQQYIPKFLEDDETEVSRLLQKLNITSTKEVEMFKQLCHLKESKISYKDALAVTNTQNEEFIFTNFIQKIEKYQIAILRTEVEGLVQTPAYVRLCDENSEMFFKEYISEQINTARTSSTAAIPTQKTLYQKEITISKSYFATTTQRILMDAFKILETSQPQGEEDIIYVIPLHHNELFLFTLSTLPQIIPLCISRIQGFLQEQRIVLTIATIINLPSSDLEYKVAYDDILLWDEVITLLNEKIDLLQANSLLSNFIELIDLIIIMYNVLKPKLAQMKEEEENQQILSQFNSKILNKMRSHKDSVTHVAFIEIMQDEARSSSFTTEETTHAIEQFFEKHVLSSDKTQALEDEDIILKVNQWYLHTNLIIKIIAERYAPLSRKLNDYYSNTLSKYLLKKLAPSEIVFFGENSFEISVHQKVAEFDELYTQLLKMPIFLASILSRPIKIATSSKNSISNMSPSKRIALFFNLRTKALLPWYEIFNLRLSTMVEQAYKNLSWFRKCIFMFTGRYSSMKERIVKVQKAYSTMRPIEANPKASEKKLPKIQTSVKIKS